MVKLLLLVLGLGLSQVLAAYVPSPIENDLIQFLTKARAFGVHPDHFQLCFDHHTRYLTEANDAYDLAYKACIGEADTSLQAADNATAKDRNEMFRRVDNACQYVWQCQLRGCEEGVECKPSVVDELNCISGTSKQSSSTLNDVAASAALTKDQLDKNYQAIIADRDICTLIAQQRFKRETESLYANWERCLKGEDWTTRREPTTTTLVYPTTTPRPSAAPAPTTTPRPSAAPAPTTTPRPSGIPVPTNKYI